MNISTILQQAATMKLVWLLGGLMLIVLPASAPAGLTSVAIKGDHVEALFQAIDPQDDCLEYLLVVAAAASVVRSSPPPSMLVALLGHGKPAIAAPPVPTDPPAFTIELPAGLACNFDLSIEGSVGTGT